MELKGEKISIKMAKALREILTKDDIQEICSEFTPNYSVNSAKAILYRSRRVSDFSEPLVLYMIEFGIKKANRLGTTLSNLK